MLYLMRGTSCSGKDTLIERNFPGLNKNHILSSDDFRMMMFGNKEVQQFNSIVFDTIHKITEYRIANRAPMTIINSTNIKFKDIQFYVELCDKYKEPYKILSLSPPPLEELKQRNENRFRVSGFYVPEDVLETHFNRYINAMPKFIEHAKETRLCGFIEVDQKYEIINRIS